MTVNALKNWALNQLGERTLPITRCPDGRSHGLRGLDGVGAIAVHANAVDGGVQDLAGGGDDAAGLQHAQHMRRAGEGVADHGLWILAWHELAIGLVVAVGEDLQRRAQAAGLAGLRQRRCGRGQQDQLAVDVAHGLRDQVRSVCIGAGEVVECAVWFDVRDAGAVDVGQGLQRADLVGQQRAQLLVAEAHGAATKAL